MTTVGGVLSLMGILILFRFGFPQPSFVVEESYLGLESANVLSDGKTVAEARADASRKELTYKRLSMVALGLIVVGSVMQMISVWL